jgi:hypothetical protein
MEDGLGPSRVRGPRPLWQSAPAHLSLGVARAFRVTALLRHCRAHVLDEGDRVEDSDTRVRLPEAFVLHQRQQIGNATDEERYRPLNREVDFGFVLRIATDRKDGRRVLRDGGDPLQVPQECRHPLVGETGNLASQGRPVEGPPDFVKNVRAQVERDVLRLRELQASEGGPLVAQHGLDEHDAVEDCGDHVLAREVLRSARASATP